MIITTTERISGTNMTELGLVMGNTVQSVHMGKDIMAALRIWSAASLPPTTKC